MEAWPFPELCYLEKVGGQLVMSVAIIEGQSGSETGHGDAMLDSSADCSAPWLLQQESKQNEDIIKFVYRTKLNHCESGHKLEVISRLLVTKTITAAFFISSNSAGLTMTAKLAKEKPVKWEGEKKKKKCIVYLGLLGWIQFWSSSHTLN